jgi:hypothetical protein
MPWCGYWVAASSVYGWVVPVIGLLFVGIMLFACFRGFGFGCMGTRRRTSDEIASLQREIDGLKADAQKSLLQQK